MSNTITAFFKGRIGVAEAVYQNDYGIIMNFDSIELPAHFDCYFSVIGEDEAIPGVGADRQVVIPNTCLSKAGNVTLHIPLHTGANDSEVEYVVYFKVIGRARPADDGTPVQMSAIERALALLQAPLTNIEDIVSEALSFTGPTIKSLQQKDTLHDASIASLDSKVTINTNGIASLSNRMDSFTNLEEGSTTGDAELIDGRTVDGVTYANIGGAIRAINTNLKNDISNLQRGIYYPSIIRNVYIDKNDGSELPYDNWGATDYIPLLENVSFVVNSPASGIYNAFYDSNKNFISSFSIPAGESIITSPSNAAFVRMSNVYHLIQQVYYKWKDKKWYTSLGWLTSAEDLNELTKEGYYITSYNNNPINSPSGVKQGIVIVMTDSTTAETPFVSQTFIAIHTAKVYVRVKAAGSAATWGNWNTFDYIWNESNASKSFNQFAEAVQSGVSVAGDRVRIMAYNVAHYNNDSSTYLDSIHEKLINIKKLLMFSKADIIATPEDSEYIDGEQTKDSNQWLYNPIYPFRVGGGSCCLHSKTQYVESKNIVLPGGWTIRRGTIRVNEKNLTVYSVHLAVSSSADRATQLSQIFSQIETDHPNYYVIAGDMNCFEDGESEAFKAACEEHGCTLANGGYLGWISTHKDGSAIDNIVVSNNIVIENTEVLGNWYESLYSDHYPLISDIVLLD